MSFSVSGIALLLANGYKNLVSALHWQKFPEGVTLERQISLTLDFIENLPFDVHHTASQNWLLNTQKFSLIPDDLYSKGMGKSLLSYTARLAEGDHIFTDHWQQREIINVYAIPQALVDLLQDHFAGSTFSHGASALEKVYNYFPQSVTYAWLHVEPQEVDLWIARDGGVLFYNKFQYSVEEDVLYFILFAFEQNGILPTDLELHLSGHSLKGEKMYVLLEQYIGEVSETILPREFKLEGKLSSRELRQHLNLLGGL